METITEHLKKAPGGYEVEYKGFKWFTRTSSNAECTLPQDFVFQINTAPVTLNPQGQTKIQQKLLTEYADMNPRGLSTYDS